MTGLFKNRLVYLSTSFVLFLIALPLVSVGTTSGPRLLLWLGFAALCVAALIPPVQRLVCEAPASDKSGADDSKEKK